MSGSQTLSIAQFQHVIGLLSEGEMFTKMVRGVRAYDMCEEVE